MHAPRTLAGGIAVLVVFGACSQHDPVVERRGGPLPDSGVTTPDPASCAPDGTGGEPGVPASPIRFCQAERVLRESCQRCHQDPPLNGAPFALVTYEDTQQAFSDDQLRWERMREVVDADVMPPRGSRLDPPVEPLTCEQKATLLGWLEQCAPPEGGTDCEGRSEELLSCD